ncbi:hypothetical protein PS3A_14990 [Pseudomonas sp. 3A(2025)]
MGYVRKNVWELGSDWAEPVLWYARGVKAMKARPINDPTSWRFYAAIHGFEDALWIQQGYLASGETLPSPALREQYWSQCQHATWYFLPWHRGYILAIENILRGEIIKLGGPSDWALPYWNYFRTGQNGLPPAFSSPDWPDGTGDNPLYVVQRYGPDNNSEVYVPLDYVNEDALGEPEFTGVSSGGSPGFGGIDTGYNHKYGVHGAFEHQPHDMVHVYVGGQDPSDSDLVGLMGTPRTAGLDPIFWLHHANIDRLWQTWNDLPTSLGDPTESKWLQGPASIGEHPFVMPTPEGEAWDYTPQQMVSLQALGYSYDDYSPANLIATPVLRAKTLGLNLEVANVSKPARDVELLGASTPNIALSGSGVRSTVALAGDVHNKVATRFRTLLSSQAALPDRVFLNLENVRADADGFTFKVLAQVAAAPGVTDVGEHVVGSIGLFGVSAASTVSGGHAGEGVTYVLDITGFFDALQLAGNAALPAIEVRLVPRHPIPDSANVTIGRISLFRQGQ